MIDYKAECICRLLNVHLFPPLHPCTAGCQSTGGASGHVTLRKEQEALPGKFSCARTLMCTRARAQSSPTLCNPMDCSPPGSSVHGILQARILEWVALPSSRRSSSPRDQNVAFLRLLRGRWILYHCTTWEALEVSLLILGLNPRFHRAFSTEGYHFHCAGNNRETQGGSRICPGEVRDRDAFYIHPLLWVFEWLPLNARITY